MSERSYHNGRYLDDGSIDPPWYIVRTWPDGSFTQQYLLFQRFFDAINRREREDLPTTDQGWVQFMVEVVLVLCKQCPAFFIHQYLQIRTKESGLVRFDDWTPAQVKLYRRAMNHYARGLPVRLIILKARQMGISTLCEALLFWRIYFQKFSNALIATHEEDATENLFAMFKLYYELLPTGPLGLKVPTDKNNESEMSFDEPKASERTADNRHGSRIKVKTVALGGTSKEKQGKGRSQTIHAFHASEVGFWTEPKRFWTGVSQTIPKLKNTMVFLESTANGYGNWFHEFWGRAARGWDLEYDADKDRLLWRCLDPDASSTSYTPVFFSWLEHPKYASPLRMKRYLFTRSLDKAERNLVEGFGASLEQLQWRRETIADECGGDVKMFHQEYPTTPEEAFISTGRRVFDMGGLERQEARIRNEPDPKRGDFDLEYSKQNERWQGAWRADDFGPVRIYADPIPGVEYGIGADSCYGKPDGDFACIQVLRKDNWEQVCTVHGRLDADELANLVVAVGRHYNDAKAVIEVDGPGIHTLLKVQEMDYWNLYLRLTFDGVSKKPQRVFGWKMSTKSRQHMVSALKAAVREDELILHDMGTVKEMREWVLKKTSGIAKAKEMPADPTHGYDDRVVSLGEGLVGAILQNGIGGDVPGIADPEPEQKRGVWMSTEEGSHPTLGLNW